VRISLKIHGVTSHKTVFFVVTAVRICSESVLSYQDKLTDDPLLTTAKILARVTLMSTNYRLSALTPVLPCLCQPSKAQWLFYVPPGLTFTNSTYGLPTQCTYVFSVGIRTHSDYFPTHNCLASITETEYVYCAVRTVSLNIYAN